MPKRSLLRAGGNPRNVQAPYIALTETNKQTAYGSLFHYGAGLDVISSVLPVWRITLTPTLY